MPEIRNKYLSPALLRCTGHRHKEHRSHLLYAEPITFAGQQGEGLAKDRAAEGEDQPSTLLQLLDEEGGKYGWPRR